MHKLKLDKQLFWLLTSLFVVMTGYGVLLPVLPFFIERLMIEVTDSNDVAFHFSILTAIFPATLVVTAPFWGRIADRVGHRSLIIIGLGGFTTMQLFIGLSTSLFMLYIARIMGSIFSSFLLPVVNANISAITKTTDRKKAMAWSGTAVSAGIIIGPGISGLVAENSWHINWAYRHYLISDLSIPFFLLTLVGVVVLICTWFVLKPVNKEERTNDKISSRYSFSEQWQSIKAILLLSLILQLSITLFESVFTLYGKEVAGYSISFISITLLVCGITMAVFQPIMAKWGYLLIKNEETQIIVGFAISGFALLLFTFGPHPVLVILLIILYGLGSSLVVPNLLAGITIKSPQHSGSALGWQSSFNGIGQIAGPIGGAMVYSIHKTAPFLIGGLLLFIVAGQQLIYRNKKIVYNEQN